LVKHAAVLDTPLAPVSSFSVYGGCFFTIANDAWRNKQHKRLFLSRPRHHVGGVHISVVP
jgi:hypothetical protein